MVPDFFIVGHPKCGTTAMYRMLRRHPQIFMPALKEPRFLASDQRDRFTTPLTAPLPRTLEEYLSLFDQAKPGQRIGEASPSYLRSRTAAREIARIQPAARIIAILREPASFLRSLHLQFVQAQNESEKDLGRAIALEAVRREGKRIPRHSRQPQALQYTEQVRYVEQLRRYHSAFSQEQVLVLIYEDFRRENEDTVRSVLRFLEVDETLPLATVEANPTMGVRGQRLDRILDSVWLARGPLSRAVKTAVKAVAPRQLNRSTVRSRLFFTAPPPQDERLMRELRVRFKPEVVALSEYLGRDLVGLWGYDEVG